MHLAVVLLRAITPMVQPYRLFFFFTYSKFYSALSSQDTVSAHSVGDPDWHFSKRQYHIVRLFWEWLIWLLLFCFISPIQYFDNLLSSIIYLNNIDQILCQLLVDMISLILIFCLLMLLLPLFVIVSRIGSENSFYREKPNFLF